MNDFDVDAEPDGGLTSDPRVQAGLEHLQRAAREMIAASRALLDVAEELVDDPRAAASLVEMVGGLAKVKASTVDPRASHPTDGDDGEPPVQRIPVS